MTFTTNANNASTARRTDPPRTATTDTLRRTRIRWVASRRALLGGDPPTGPDLLRIELTLTPIGTQRARAAVALLDGRDGTDRNATALPEPIPAPFDGASVELRWIPDAPGDLLHLEAPGALAATFHAPDADPFAPARQLLYARSPLPGALGLPGGRYHLSEGVIEPIEAQVEVVSKR